MKLLITLFTLGLFILTEDNETKTMNQHNSFEISYTFKSDIKKVFEMWINPDSFSKWLGPDEAKMAFINTNK